MSSYSELHRPQFHFSAKKNWINDPNGLVYHAGIWHLFFQHNIEAPTWGPMWWGHAVSTDLLHWRQLDHALYPDEMGSMFSGSAVIDHHNTAGFGKDAMLLFYTAAGNHATPPRPFVQCLAFSVDGGQTFTKYKHNPIVDWMQADNRDPKVVWDDVSQKWVMALYLEDERYCLLSSSDLKEWSQIQDIVLPGTYECPDFFPLVDEDGVNRWVFSGAGSGYLVGQFDGNKFVAETELRHYDGGPNNYAAQTWSNAPDGRCIQISWMAGGLYPEMPFNQQLSIPVELTLLGRGSDARLARRPVMELSQLHGRKIEIDQKVIANGSPFLVKTDSKLLDISFRIARNTSKGLYLLIRGQYLAFDWAQNTMTMTPSGTVKMVGDKPPVRIPDAPSLVVRILVDVTSVEVFLNEGEISASYCFLPGGYESAIEMHTYSGQQVVENFEMHELKSVWTE